MALKESPMTRIRIAGFIAGLLLLAATAYAQGQVVAIGDVHGAYPEFVSILQQTSLIDGNRKWIGGSAILVQMGDLLDRGRQSRDCLDLLMGLERQAKRRGGKVIPLLGNHEAWNILGGVNYVTAEIYRTFATNRSEKRREQAYQDYMKFLSAHRDHSHTALPTDDEATHRKWVDEHPPGFFEYRDAFGPGGKYGAWLRMHPAIVRIGDGLFLHGGLNPALQFRDVAELNDRIRSEVAAFDFFWQSLVQKKVIWRYMKLEEAMRQVDEELKWMQARGKVEDPEVVQQMQQLLGLSNWMITSPEGPLWYRGLALEPEEKLTDALKALLARLKAQYIVEGHTVLSKSAITTRFDNHVFLIDTGMLKEVYGGRASALEIQNGQFTARYADGEREILVAPGLWKTRSSGIRGKGDVMGFFEWDWVTLQLFESVALSTSSIIRIF